MLAGNFSEACSPIKNKGKEKNMKFKENKSKLTLISLFLMISIIASSIFAISPIANAQTVTTQKLILMLTLVLALEMAAKLV